PAPMCGSPPPPPSPPASPPASKPPALLRRNLAAPLRCPDADRGRPAPGPPARADSCHRRDLPLRGTGVARPEYSVSTFMEVLDGGVTKWIGAAELDVGAGGVAGDACHVGECGAGP